MSNRDYPSYLRLVRPSEELHSDSEQPLEGALLAFANTSSLSAIQLESALVNLRPAWVFDLRPLPYFNIEYLTRSRVFGLFRSLEIIYRDVSGQLQIRDRNDASLNSGLVAEFLNHLLYTAARPAPVLILADDDLSIDLGMEVLPRMLQHPECNWSAFVLTASSDASPQVRLRTRSGETISLDTPISVR